ncbi:hypothetical protein AT258_17820 [Bacillus wiedmannii]|nr:hypothetical protein AT258_17820 [Bacillus wiedmannii]
MAYTTIIQYINMGRSLIKGIRLHFKQTNKLMESERSIYIKSKDNGCMCIVPLILKETRLVFI